MSPTADDYMPTQWGGGGANHTPGAFQRPTPEPPPRPPRHGNTVDWTQAACRGMGPDLFYPPRGAPPTHTEAAKAVCHRCPIRLQCLQTAVEDVERWGIWGGTTEPERRILRRFRRLGKDVA